MLVVEVVREIEPVLPVPDGAVVFIVRRAFDDEARAVLRDMHMADARGIAGDFDRHRTAVAHRDRQRAHDVFGLEARRVERPDRSDCPVAAMMRHGRRRRGRRWRCGWSWRRRGRPAEGEIVVWPKPETVGAITNAATATPQRRERKFGFIVFRPELSGPAYRAPHSSAHSRVKMQERPARRAREQTSYATRR